jgi:hypothetical protein
MHGVSCVFEVFIVLHFLQVLQNRLKVVAVEKKVQGKGRVCWRSNALEWYNGESAGILSSLTTILLQGKITLNFHLPLSSMDRRTLNFHLRSPGMGITLNFHLPLSKKK